MNMHLAKLHIHVFTRVNYEVEVKVFPNSSGVRRYTFLVNWKFTCAVALAHVTHVHGFLRKVHRAMNVIVGCANVGQVAYRGCILGVKYALPEA